jgi:uncharacterized RDD family membrane protein YckC
MIPAKRVLASRAKRLAGFVADLVVLTGVALVLVPLTGASFDDVDTLSPTSTFSLANLVVLALYQIGFIAWRGQTPGKVIVGTEVVDIDTGAVPDLTGAVARFVLPAAAGFVPGFGTGLTIAVYAWILWDPRRQGLHDKLARTVVVDLRTASAQEPGE